MVLLAVMLTTAPEAALAAALKLPGAAALPVLPGGASITATEPRLGRRCNQSGLSVATTKYAASSTVTVWEKSSQVLRMVVGVEGCKRRWA